MKNEDLMLRDYRNRRKKMTRLEFEKLILGTWESKADDRYRQNGEFQTTVENQWKILRTKKGAIRAKNWGELAKILFAMANEVNNEEELPKSNDYRKRNDEEE